MRLDQKIRFTNSLVKTLLFKARECFPEFDLEDQDLDIHFTMTGMSAGCAGFKNNRHYVNFNRRLMNDQDNWQDYKAETIAHEVSHVICHRLAMVRKVPHYKPHGREWKHIMYTLGYIPSRTHDYDVSAAKTRNKQTFKYKCTCRTFDLSWVNHKKIILGEPRTCPICDNILELIK